MSLKDNWNKTPLFSHRRFVDLGFVVWGFSAVALLIAGVTPLVALCAPAGSVAFCYLFARLTP